MKFILAPLVAVATFASLVAAAAPDNEKTIDYSKYAVKGPVSDIYAYWPDKKDSDPDTRVVELLMPSTGRTFPYRLHYKDPKDNKYDLSVAEDAEEALAAAEEDGSTTGKMAGAEYAALDLDSKVSMSVYLDKDDKVVYMVQGSTVPTSYKDMLVHQDAFVRNLHLKLDPNTPGIEDLKDPGSIVAQVLLNKLALEGPDALEDAKNDPSMVKILDGLYDSADEYYEEKAKLEAKVAEEEKQNQAGKMEKRHNKPHHHHNKASHKKKN
ncbi:hypothetical protein EC957_012114 [Mortierella hygrophila]|uniref:Uncharacterized protein n=1 Tax=Mortierella hygrophila TaxID=979708 RepID=A0A9P6F8F0_9FUNG|nr:hypothetical protein EC957_012114 [Mortierella hygrophila]